MTRTNRVLAFLPYHLLCVASRVASRDIYYEALSYIYIEPLNGGIRFISSDSVRALRITCSDPIWYCTKPILIDRRAFPRDVKSLRVVRIDQLGRRPLCSGQVYTCIDDLYTCNPMRSIPSDKIELLGSNNIQYPSESIDNAWPPLDHQNTVYFNANNVEQLLDFLRKVKGLAGDSEELTNEEVNNLLKACVVNVQTRQDKFKSMLIFTAYNGQELEIPLETPIYYEDISFDVKKLLDFFELVNRYSPSGVITMHINRATLSGQALFTATIGPYINMEYLLMPVVR